MFDCIIVGAGFAGAVIAERLAGHGHKKVLVLDKRYHVGGNMYDEYDRYGVLIHKYGPHIFHTSNKNVLQYLSRFTSWHPYEHKVLARVAGRKVPVPFNLNTLRALYPADYAAKLESKLIKKFGLDSKVPILDLMQTKDKELRNLADFIYQNLFLNYNLKQWNARPEELDKQVSARVPVHISHDDRYFQDSYQFMPERGYTKVFERMLKHDNLTVWLNTNFNQVVRFEGEKIFFLNQEFTGKFIYTGEIDEFFGFKFGKLGYRSLKFEFSNHCREFYQEVAVVNYPNDYKFIRITETKHMTGQQCDHTTITKEFPQPYHRNGKPQDIPYYPIPQAQYQDLYARYYAEARKLKNIVFVGRLAEYQYYNMDSVIARALQVAEQLLSAEGGPGF
jgi:UDP-galactopyranose mutase